jgi:phage gpG-like protein
MGGIYGSTKNAAKRLENFAREIPAQVAKQLAPMLDERVRDMFANETDPYGNKWAPLKASTLRRKKGNSVILYRTGALGQGSYVLYTGRRLVFTFGPAAQYAQDGDPGRGNRPPRMVAPAYGMPKSWRDDAKRAAAEVAKRRAA